MQRDMNLARMILLAVESHPDGTFGQVPQIKGFNESQVGYHVKLLHDAGLIEAEDATHMGASGPIWLPMQLTWAGHDFLDSARDDGVWTRALSAVGSSVKSTTLEILRDLLVAFARQAIRERCGVDI